MDLVMTINLGALLIVIAGCLLVLAVFYYKKHR